MSQPVSLGLFARSESTVSVRGAVPTCGVRRIAGAGACGPSEGVQDFSGAGLTHELASSIASSTAANLAGDMRVGQPEAFHRHRPVEVEQLRGWCGHKPGWTG